MFNLIQADLFKLRKSLAIRILFGITAVSAIIMAVMAYLIPRGKIDSSMTGIGFMFSDINIMSILGAVVAGIFICGDFDNKTIHDAIANGSSRSCVIISKSITFFFALELILLPYIIVTGIALSTGNEFSMGSVSVGFLHVLTSVAGTDLSSVDILKIFAVLFTLMIVYAAQLSICIPLAFASKKPVLVVAIYYGLSILCAQLMGLKDSSLLFDSIFGCTPFGGNYTFVTLDTGVGDLIKALCVSLIFTIVMITITYYSFRKKEIK